MLSDAVKLNFARACPGWRVGFVGDLSERAQLVAPDGQMYIATFKQIHHVISDWANTGTPGKYKVDPNQFQELWMPYDQFTTAIFGTPAFEDKKLLLLEDK